MANSNVLNIENMSKSEEKLYLKIYSDVIEIWKEGKLSREHLYHYVLNNRTCGEKRVEEYTRTNIIYRLYKLEEKIIMNDEGNNTNDLIDEIKQIGKIIHSFVLSEKIRKELFNENNFGKHLTIENMDNLIPLELAYDGNNFLSFLYPIGRAVPTYPTSYAPQMDPKKLKVFIISNPTEDLQKARKEGAKVAKFMSILNKNIKGNISIDYYTGKEVTKELVLFNILFNGKCNIFHFCGHCIFDNENPSQSSLILNDGPLKAYEIEELKGNPIIFNNACSTATEVEEKKFFGRGLVEGLASNFVRFGALAYIGPLWPVDDDIAMKFACIFYKNLIESGFSLGESLRAAKKELYDRDPITGFSCLPYVLFGDPSFNMYRVSKDYLTRSTFWNEKAIYEIMKLEKEYSGLEMLTVNEHHWMFWKKNTLDKWVEKITQSEKEQRNLLLAFDDYQKHFRKLGLAERKCFKIILNLKTFKKYIEKLDFDEASDIIIDSLKFLELSTFLLIFYNGQEEEIEEYEIVSKNMDENKNVADNICVVIKQSRIDRDSVYYFLYFNDTPELIIDHIKRYNNYKQLCIQQYKNNYADIFSYLKEKDVNTLTDKEIKKVTKYILEQLLQSKKGKT